MKIQQQYSNGGEIKFAMNSKIPFGPMPQPDSNGFISAKYYKPITSYKKREIKKIMRGLEWSAAIVPDSINKENGLVDSIYMNPYKIKYLEEHNLKTKRMLFHNTTEVINKR